MDSDEEHNSADELQPRTPLRPTPAPFSHAPFKSVVPDVSLVFNNTKNQPTIDAPQSAPNHNSEDFESYNAWRHKNLKNTDESSPRFKYYTTSPRYNDDIIPIKTSIDQHDDSPRMAPLQPVNYRPLSNNIQADPNQPLRNNSPLDRQHESPATNRDLRLDVSQNKHTQKYSKTVPIQCVRSPSNLPSYSYECLQSSQQSYGQIVNESCQQPPQPHRCSEPNCMNQNYSPCQAIPFHSNFLHSQFRNPNSSPASNNLYQHQNCNGPEMLNQNRELYFNEIHERPIVNNSLARNVQFTNRERIVSDATNHRGQGDYFAETVRAEIRPDQGISVADLYRLIQMQNEEIRALRTQVQGLLDQRNGLEVQGIARVGHEQRQDCNSSGRPEDTRTQEQSDRNLRMGYQDNRQVNGANQLEERQSNGCMPIEKNLQQPNRNGIHDGDRQTHPARRSHDNWDRNTSDSPVNERTRAAAEPFDRHGARNDAGRSTEDESDRPVACQSRAMVQQVSIGVMTSFVDQNVYYQRQDRRPTKSNALLRQATAANAWERETVERRTGERRTGEQGTGERGTVGRQTTERGVGERGTMEQGSVEHRRTEREPWDRGTPSRGMVERGTNPIVTEPLGEGETRVKRTYEARDERDATRDDDSLTLHGLEIQTPREPERSPDASMHLDLRDFPSSASSASSLEGDPPPVGWTFYHNVVGQVNEMLHAGEGRQPPESTRRDGKEAFDALRQHESSRQHEASRPLRQQAQERKGEGFELRGRYDQQHLHGEIGHERHDENRRTNDTYGDRRDYDHENENRGKGGNPDVEDIGRNNRENGNRGDGQYPKVDDYQRNNRESWNHENGQHRGLDDYQQNNRENGNRGDVQYPEVDQRNNQKNGNFRNGEYPEMDDYQRNNRESRNHENGRHQVLDDYKRNNRENVNCRNEQYPEVDDYQRNNHKDGHRGNGQYGRELDDYQRNDRGNGNRGNERCPDADDYHRDVGEQRYRGNERGTELDSHRARRDFAQHRETYQAQRMMSVQRFDPDAIREATFQQLRKLGVSLCEPEGSAAVAAKKVTFDSVYYMPMQPAYVGPSDVSLHMDALAAKYLHGERRGQGHGMPRDQPGYDLTGQVRNMSMATMRYLERYQLLPGTAQPKPPAAQFVEQPARFPRHEPARNDFRAEMPDQRTVPPPKILDITALKDQPKFI